MLTPAVPAGYSVVYALTNVTSSNTDNTVAIGGTYSTTLSADQDYVLGSVTVTMGGIDITSSAYSNGVVSINNVTGEISITASASLPSYNYVTDGLVFHLDGSRAQSSEWVDSASGYIFNLSNCNKVPGGIYFNGSTSFGQCTTAPAPAISAFTAEIVYKNERDDVDEALFSWQRFHTSSRGLCYSWDATNQRFKRRLSTGSAASASTLNGDYTPNVIKVHSFSESLNYQNKAEQTFGAKAYNAYSNQYFYLGKVNGSSQYFKGTIYQIRIYNRALTENEILSNQAIDYDRYGIV